MSSKKVVLPTEEDGRPVDYLEEDPEIPNQKYCIVSFLSPEKIIKQKEQFFFEKFVRWMDYEWKVKGVEHFLAFIAKKYSIKVDDVLTDLKEFEKVHADEIRKTDIDDQFKTFMLKNEKELQEQFDIEVGFATNVRGVKIRRSFATIEETQLYAKVLQRRYPKDNLYIGKVGAWLPWEPSEHLMPNVEYAEKELNEIMRRYKENESNRELFVAEERQLAIERQKKENDDRRQAYTGSSGGGSSGGGSSGGGSSAAQAGGSAAEELASQEPAHPSEGALRDTL
jgi:hypothetical protein